MEDKSGCILIVDDDLNILKRTERLLRFNGYEEVISCANPLHIWPLIEKRKVLAMVLDLLMPGMDGYQVLEEVNSRRPDIPVIVATAVDDLEVVIRCMKAGAFDYVPKSAESTRLLASIKHAEAIGQLLEDNRALKQSLLAENQYHPEHFSKIVTRNRQLLALFKYVEAIAGSDKPILITGESGTGKELFANAIHAASRRSGKLVTVNAAGLDDTMFSDTLFGHKRGAFTGAESDRPGLIEQAAGGTLFLDEIGDLSAQSQIKLLRLIEQRLYYPLGADLTKVSDALIIAATHRDLKEETRAGRFRLDLFYRLETHHISIPPLRERPEDLSLLVEHFAEIAAQKFGRKKPYIPEELYQLLNTWDFPGNVRELESMIHDAVGSSNGASLSLTSLKSRIFDRHIPRPAAAKLHEGLFHSATILPTLQEANQMLIQEALRRAGGNQGIAAGYLGISRTALNRRLNREEEA
ncbi:MAG: sigma-54 dependent transcriptional regulator [Spirochaetes bacterium]|nr:sigma-54 dependent transcriptional regulator [Spirochaetota bacterium]MBU0954081.1 sigma-54 dependent transcriptional regulator [Spirochaetota bacterium]